MSVSSGPQGVAYLLGLPLRGAAAGRGRERPAGGGAGAAASTPRGGAGPRGLASPPAHQLAHSLGAQAAAMSSGASVSALQRLVEQLKLEAGVERIKVRPAPAPGLGVRRPPAPARPSAGLGGGGRARADSCGAGPSASRLAGRGGRPRGRRPTRLAARPRAVGVRAGPGPDPGAREKRTCPREGGPGPRAPARSRFRDGDNDSGCPTDARIPGMRATCWWPPRTWLVREDGVQSCGGG